MADLTDYSVKCVFYGMEQHTLLIMMQNSVFYWYDMACLNDYSTKHVFIVYGMP